jgi:hypothetical protein
MRTTSKPKVDSPFMQQSGPTAPQFGLGTLLLVMLIFSVISVGLFYSVRVPAIAKEINAIFGKVQETGTEGTDRTTQFIFVMFCYTAPLMMAAVVSLLALAMRRFQIVWSRSNPDTDDEPFVIETLKR